MKFRLASLCTSLAIAAGCVVAPGASDAATLTKDETGKCVEGLTAAERQQIMDEDRRLRSDPTWMNNILNYLAEENPEFPRIVSAMKDAGYFEAFMASIPAALNDEDFTIDHMEKWEDEGLFAAKRPTKFHQLHMELLTYLQNQGYSEQGAEDIASMWFDATLMINWDSTPETYEIYQGRDLSPVDPAEADAKLERAYRRLGMLEEADRNRLMELLTAENYEETRAFVIKVNKRQQNEGKSSPFLGLTAISTQKDRELNEFALEQIDPYVMDMKLLRVWQLVHCVSGMEGDSNIFQVPDYRTERGLDSDNDGLLDEWEIAGVTPDGVLLPGADPMRKDLYLQVNWMSPRTQEGTRALNRLSLIQPINDLMPSLDEQDKASALIWGFDTTPGKSMKPSQKSMDLLREYFDKMKIDDFSAPGVKDGINVHFDAADLSTQDFGEQAAGGQTLEHKAWYQAVDEDFNKKVQAEPSGLSEKRAKYFYQLFAVDLVMPDPYVGGIAMLPGNYSMVAMGARYRWDEKVAETMAHEIGHNLGLGHNGAIDVKVGPNSTRVSRESKAYENKLRPYRSIMNYRYSFGPDEAWFDPDRTPAGDDWVGNKTRHEFVADGDNLILGASNRNYNRIVAGKVFPAPEPIVHAEPQIDPEAVAAEIDAPGQASVLFTNPEVITPNEQGLNATFVVENLSKAQEDFDVTIKVGERTVTKKLTLAGRAFEEVSIPLTLADVSNDEVSLTVTVAGKEFQAKVPADVPDDYTPPQPAPTNNEEGSSDQEKTILTVLLSLLGVGGLIAAVVAALPQLKSLLP